MTPLISIKNLSISYKQKFALQHVNLDIFSGKILALIGPSGCGKTSLLNCLNRMTDLIPDCLVTGSIQLEQLELVNSNIDVNQLRQNVGMIFQKPNPFPLSIQENIHLPLREHAKLSKSEQLGISEDLLKRVGLWQEVENRLTKPALSLSGGQQQRLCIARALTLNPKVLLMDEPCSALDPLSTEIIENLINQIRHEITIVIVTHNLAQAKRLSDQTAVFWNHNQCGKLIEHDQTKKIFESPTHPDTIAYIKGLQG